MSFIGAESKRSHDEIAGHTVSSRFEDDVEMEDHGSPHRAKRHRYSLSSVLSSPPYKSTSCLLRGFNSPCLDLLHVTFLRQVPEVYICVNCRVIHARSARLSCGHTLCEPCLDTASRLRTPPRFSGEESSDEGAFNTCPIDGGHFVADLATTSFTGEALYKELVLCPNSEFGCPFRGELRCLQHHCQWNCRFVGGVFSGRQEASPKDNLSDCSGPPQPSTTVRQRKGKTAKRRLGGDDFAGICPIDGHPFNIEVEMPTFLGETVLKEMVFCPNRRFGCSFRDWSSIVVLFRGYRNQRQHTTSFIEAKVRCSPEDIPVPTDLRRFEDFRFCMENHGRQPTYPYPPTCFLTPPPDKSTSYVLRGFNSPYLDGVRIKFLRKVPCVFICSNCQVIHARGDDYAGICPIDGHPFNIEVEMPTFLGETVLSEMVFCPNTRFGCSFRGNHHHHRSEEERQSTAMLTNQEGLVNRTSSAVARSTAMVANKEDEQPQAASSGIGSGAASRSQQAVRRDLFKMLGPTRSCILISILVIAGLCAACLVVYVTQRVIYARIQEHQRIRQYLRDVLGESGPERYPGVPLPRQAFIFACQTEHCTKEGKHLRRNVAWSLDPCRDFHEYACSGDARRPSLREDALSHFLVEVRTVLGKWGQYRWTRRPPVHAKASQFFRACDSSKHNRETMEHDLAQYLRGVDRAHRLPEAWAAEVCRTLQLFPVFEVSVTQVSESPCIVLKEPDRLDGDAVLGMPTIVSRKHRKLVAKM
ncbi:hypothetical protein HPB50_024199 [Hyalomma asiaticum]|uniref:Uncharacterized protein n=1 Tax=Hyalomma asiaticum TaxID=266040 RepID=A0ACB7RQP7_HYAAI|nr:hypothetical protein HPB50_024199 [Hyalomma asiaticum]